MTMSAGVSDDNLTLIWTVTINDDTEVIDKHNDLYILGAKNKVIFSYIILLLSLPFKNTLKYTKIEFRPERLYEFLHHNYFH